MTYSLLSCHVLIGDGRSLATLPLRKAHKPSSKAMPTRESKKSLTSFFISLPLQAVYREARRVFLGILRVENGIGQLRGSQILRGHFYTQFLHRFLVNIRSQHFLGGLLIVGCTLDHAPPPELTQPPVAVSPRREVAVALVEDHVVGVLLLMAFAVVILAL